MTRRLVWIGLVLIVLAAVFDLVHADPVHEMFGYLGIALAWGCGIAIDAWAS